MPGRLEFELGVRRASQRRDPDKPMRLLVLGDFSGNAAAARPPLASRPTLRVDIDNFDALIKRLQPRVILPAGEITFEQIDDFHPDRLSARLEVFKQLRHLRANPPAADQAAEDDVLRRLLGKPAEPEALSTGSPAAAGTDGIDALIRNIVQPHIVKDTSARTRMHLEAADAATAAQMRALLHDPAFQSLEATWRGVQWLISSFELDENLQLHLFDVTRDELLADIVSAGGRITQTGLHQALVDRKRDALDGQGWSAIIGLFAFGPSETDMGLLAALGLIASLAGGPLLAAADQALTDEAADGSKPWQALRDSEAAPWIGLATPRVLLRRPYGKGSDPIEAFAFEEFAGLPPHEEFLWGHPSLALALLIGRSFTARGWEMELGDEREIGELPTYMFDRDGEREMQACAERFLTENAAQALLQAGLIPLVSRRDRNAVVVFRFQSVSDPPAPLVW